MEKVAVNVNHGNPPYPPASVMHAKGVKVCRDCTFHLGKTYVRTSAINH